MNNNTDDDNSNKGNINVSSFFQTGGITAHSVNIHNSRHQRKLDDAVKNQLLAVLNHDTGLVVDITAVMDSEAMIFAEEIRDFLISKGWRHMNSVGMGFFDRQPTGQHIQKKANGDMEIIIGHNANR